MQSSNSASAKSFIIALLELSNVPLQVRPLNSQPQIFDSLADGYLRIIGVGVLLYLLAIFGVWLSPSPLIYQRLQPFCCWSSSRRLIRFRASSKFYSNVDPEMKPVEMRKMRPSHFRVPSCPGVLPTSRMPVLFETQNEAAEPFKRESPTLVRLAH